jgi:uncharacterized protein
VPASEQPIPVLIFTRTPVPGEVKTRLIPVIGAVRAAHLHTAMLWRTVDTAVQSGVGPVALWCSPRREHPVIEAIQREFGLQVHLQSGADLGERMHVAFQSQPEGSPGALLVGSDCPFLESSDLQAAAGALRAGSDAVVGPARDGGYYLIGVRRSDAALFAQVPWGSDQVLAATRCRLQGLGWDWHELAMRQDVDRPDDLAALASLANRPMD